MIVDFWNISVQKCLITLNVYTKKTLKQQKVVIRTPNKSNKDCYRSKVINDLYELIVGRVDGFFGTMLSIQETQTLKSLL